MPREPRATRMEILIAVKIHSTLAMTCTRETILVSPLRLTIIQEIPRENLMAITMPRLPRVTHVTILVIERILLKATIIMKVMSALQGASVVRPIHTRNYT